jgi:hypothetical protein
MLHTNQISKTKIVCLAKSFLTIITHYVFHPKRLQKFFFTQNIIKLKKCISTN